MPTAARSTLTWLAAVWLSATASAQQVTRISVNALGQQADGQSWYNSISHDGRFVGFHSEATNLVPADTNGADDAFVYDRITAQPLRVSIDSAGNQANGHSQRVQVSGDGRFVAFQSAASNLVPDDTNGNWDIFVHDRTTGQTSRVSVDSAGTQANGPSKRPAISYDGRYVAFFSWADNLVPDDTNGATEVFLHDRLTGQTTRLSIDSNGNQANGHSMYPAISADGRYVAFASLASNLVPDDTNDLQDIFVHDRTTGQTVRASVSSTGQQANDTSWYSTLTADGHLVAFNSYASNLVPDDTNTTADVFVHDLTTGQTIRASLSSTGQQANGSSGWPRISPDGRFLAFNSYATNLTPGDTNGYADIFVRDLQQLRTTRISIAFNAQQANNDSLVPAISSGGRFVAFYSVASNLVPADTNGLRDEFLCDRRGDLDADADVDDADLSLFAQAMSGPDTATTNPDADLDADGDCDLSDFAIFAANFTGPR
ncbi:MAG: TolB family protein [Phycisphaerae bacterium]